MCFPVRHVNPVNCLVDGIVERRSSLDLVMDLILFGEELA